MTLKNEFLTAHSISGGIGMNEKQAVQCEKITNEFAIGFGKWLVSNCYSEDGIYWWLIKTNGDIRKSTEELLEIYKKEKGL